MVYELFSVDGNRKYLTADERRDFIAVAKAHERPEVRTFALVMAYTGCRISEALELTPRRIDLKAEAVTFSDA